jgi:type I restriction enzyme M protein
MNRPAFTEGDGRLRQFDMVTANPMWNQKFPAAIYENDSYERFGRGVPPSSSADWGWVQHMVASLGPKGRMAVVLDTGAVSRGSGNQGSNKERDIRKKFVEDDLVEAVLLLPENLFYNTTAPGIVMVINRKKRHITPDSRGFSRATARTASVRNWPNPVVVVAIFDHRAFWGT